MNRFLGALPLAVALLVGVLLGLSAYTFVYARGYSYFFDDPNACVNCHVMRDHFDSWSVSPHRSVSCNGCHTPHDPLGKYLVEAENGFRHAWVFTFTQPQVIRIKDIQMSVVQHNCIACHEDTIATTFLASDGETRCVKCHPEVAHAF
jgi:cytochrome c nitrite reductase small subunit